MTNPFPSKLTLPSKLGLYERIHILPKLTTRAIRANPRRVVTIMGSGNSLSL